MTLRPPHGTRASVEPADRGDGCEFFRSTKEPAHADTGHHGPQRRGTDELTRQVEAAVGELLAKFSDRLTRVEVHLGDENAGKFGADDKRCVLEARPAGQKPVAVTNHAPTLDEACRGALHQFKRLLDTRLGRLDDRKGRATIRQGHEG